MIFMILGKSKFLIVFVLVITGVVITFLLLIFRIFVPGFVGIGLLCILFPVLARLSSEEWALFVLKRHDGYSKYNRQLGCSLKAVSRLEKRGIVTIEDGIVTLVDPDYPCIFDEPDK